MTWDKATQMEDPRVAHLRSAALYADEVYFDRKADYLVKGWLGSEAVSVVYGDSNYGKSLWPRYERACGLWQPWMGQIQKRTCALFGMRRRVKSYGPRIEAI